MNTLSPLQPFAEAPAAVTVHAGVERHPDGLCLRYLLAGNLSALLLPPLQVAPSRKERLWESTCLECFFSRPDQAGYWEVNISPAGDWNVYGFSDYRQGMHEETAIDGVTVTVNDTVDTIAVTVALPTAGLFTGKPPQGRTLRGAGRTLGPAELLGSGPSARAARLPSPLRLDAVFITNQQRLFQPPTRI